ncbi:Na(+)-translocating NADH-quinone reductase subunit C [Polystyrenella longa]|uniref:Na(+)-translocating NADH-quinone reductase subunit C n=1 Tax=Polystyrenella longa TaxID=2528007 RepID=A0A518CRM9_9PLAN|nr:Na(+)-translocating NADH-quinone reductase subunit C [Polystyrenella longa]QDU81868.1 Na(+)-translocating NADH-quinone reductase subunit C [Polystyrenella longa]
MQRDSVQNVIVVSLGLCLVCSVIVSSVAVSLRPIQKKNQELDFQKNILSAAGMWNPEEDAPTSGEGTVEEVFAQVEPRLVDLETGEYVSGSEVDFNVSDYDPRKASKDPDLSKPVENDIAGIKTRERYTFVYEVKGEDDQVSLFIFPIRGYGLWSTLRGFIAIDKDLLTIRGLTFYEHAETPGLGGEVDNPNWKATWPGKIAFNDEGDVTITVIKGQVTADDPNAQYKIDGLSGATITTKGIDNMLQYWLGENGFGPFINKIRSAGDQ